MTGAQERAPLPERLRAYLDERFPLKANAAMTALLCGGSIAAFLEGEMPLGPAVLAVLAVLPLFLLMRIADEHKDHAEDLAFRPERPVPRGLVSLGELRGVGLAAGLVPVALALWLAPAARLPLVAAVLWIWAMSVEFGMRTWLKAHPLAYLLSHMLVMPLLALLAVSFSVADARDLLTPTLAPVLALAFLAGLTLEIGRKLWGTDEEREGVETYSKLWGPGRAATVFAGVALAALAVACWAAGGHAGILAVAAAAGAAVLALAARYGARPERARARWLRGAAAATVALAYGLCLAGGFLR